MRTDRIVVLFLFGLLIVLPFAVTAELSSKKEVRVVLDGRSETVRTDATKVSGVLQDAGIDHTEYDHIFPSHRSKIKSGMPIFLYSDFKSESSGQSKKGGTSRTRTIYTSALPKGKSILVRGSKRETDVEVEAFENTRGRIVIEGGPDWKAEKVRDLKQEGSLAMLATGYSTHAKSTAPFNDGVSALGLKAGYGLVAVDPQVIPLGTRLYVEGYGYAIAADVGSGINGKQIDLCFDTHKDALRFGRKWVKVHILG